MYFYSSWHEISNYFLCIREDDSRFSSNFRQLIESIVSMSFVVWPIGSLSFTRECKALQRVISIYNVDCRPLWTLYGHFQSRKTHLVNNQSMSISQRKIGFQVCNQNDTIMFIPKITKPIERFSKRIKKDWINTANIGSLPIKPLARRQGKNCLDGTKCEEIRRKNNSNY